MEKVEENEDINKLDKTISNTFLDLLLNTLIAELKSFGYPEFLVSISKISIFRDIQV